MILFKQQAYYIGNEKLFFVDREQNFTTKEAAMKDLESFACRTDNRIPNKSYKCIVTDVHYSTEAEKTILDELISRF